MNWHFQISDFVLAHDVHDCHGLINTVHKDLDYLAQDLDHIVSTSSSTSTAILKVVEHLVVDET